MQDNGSRRRGAGAGPEPAGREMVDWLRANMPVMLTKLFPEILSSITSDQHTQQSGVAEA